MADTVSVVALKQGFELLPGAVCFFTKDDDFVLPFIEIQTKTRLHVAVAGTIVGGSDVIDVNEKRSAFGMGKCDEFHLITFNTEVLRRYDLTAGYSR